MTSDYLVTGGAGFIGSNIVHKLVADGKSVRVLDNFATGRRSNIEDVLDDIELVEGDLRSVEDVARAVKGVRYVIHLGALPSVVRSVNDPVLSNDVNINGTLNLLVQARDAGVERLVLSSSSSVYGNTPTLPKQEDMTPMPLSPYAINKLTGEHYCRVFHGLYGLKTFCLRYFNVFGPRQDPKSQYAAVIPLFIQAYRDGKAPLIHGDGGQTRDFTYVDNVVAANLACCTAPEESAGQVYNVACGDRTSINQLAETIAQIMGTDIRPEHDEPRAGDVRDSQADNTRARQNLGWEPVVDFESGLRKTVAWFMSH
jgi:UDP-glucose 4-epimerase